MCSLFLRKINQKSSLSFVTIAENEVRITLFGSNSGSHHLSHCVFVHNRATNLVSVEVSDNTEMTFESCSFIFDDQHCTGVYGASAVFNKCYLEKMSTEGAQNNNPSSQIETIRHSGIELMIREIFWRPTRKNKRADIRVVASVLVMILRVNILLS